MRDKINGFRLGLICGIAMGIFLTNLWGATFAVWMALQ